jgi:spore germination protein
MRRPAVHIAALALLPCLFTERLAEPVFSDVLSPAWQLGTGGLRSPIQISQDVLGAEFYSGASLLHRWLAREVRPVGRDLRDAVQETLSSGREFIARPAPPLRLPMPPVNLNGWIANFHAGITHRALKNYAGRMDELSIFGAGATMQGRLAPEADFIAETLRALRKQSKRPVVYLTVANIRPRGMHDHWLVERWLKNRRARQRHIWDLLRLSRGVDGLDLDYENLRPADGRAYSRLIIDLARELHARHKRLSVTVEHQTFTRNDIDWREIARHADRIRVMAYHYHYSRTSPGAVSPPDMVRNLARCALGQIPAEKLEIALPIYGFDWTRKGNGRLVATVADYRRLSRQFAAWEFRDPETQSGRIDYFVGAGKGARKRLIRHQVWYEDAASVAYKVQMLRQMGVKNIGLWQLAVGDLSDLFRTLPAKPL